MVQAAVEFRKPVCRYATHVASIVVSYQILKLMLQIFLMVEGRGERPIICPTPMLDAFKLQHLRIGES